MTREDLQEIFEYLSDSRSRFLESFRKLGWAEFARDRGGSWGSMLLIFLHMLDDEEGWLQCAARGRSMREAPDRKPVAYAGFDDLLADNASVGAATRAYLAQLSEEDLHREVEISHGSGSDRRTVERIIRHAFIDELAHLGELVGFLWQVQVEPPFIDWLDYRQAHTCSRSPTPDP